MSFPSQNTTTGASGPPPAGGGGTIARAATTILNTPPTPNLNGPFPGSIPRADTGIFWGMPAGLHLRGTNDENLIIFRRPVGINNTLTNAAACQTLEEGRRRATVMYAAVLAAQTTKRTAHLLVSVLIYVSHFSQIIISASLTALGPTAGDHTIIITLLGAINRVIAGVLALIKCQGLGERLRQDQTEFLETAGLDRVD
ncbi:hypothetical protein B0H66DRAFT_539649 [Apodospora peruviana]|uniref:SMODS and SLOG-associating 2TM effector domain-containing protein n=1 Tax=Apodospora peruviana TaxID=516989 RepID=A0AAE0IPT5_9PEZI|nr:hypothetical protein B0H66DRAFT_539649 [Apodospora peruviana]